MSNFGELSRLLRRSSPAVLPSVDSQAAWLFRGLALVDERRLDDGKPDVAASVERRERKKEKKR